MPVTRPALLLLDVNETLSDMAPMRDRFADVGLDADLAPLWFASVLREGFAVAAAGGLVPFAEVAAEQLRVLAGPDAPADEVLAAFTALDVHPDVRRGLADLAATGVRVATLSNGAASVAEGLLERAGVAEHVERVLSVEDAGAWKPAAASYRWALEQLGVEPADAMLVAVHPWDTAGAQSVGLASAWVDRSGEGHFPAYLPDPTLRVASLVDLAARLGG